MKWYLKKSDGAVFGPVDETALESWAADGRVSPDDQVSGDQKAWQPAPSLPGLNMEWVLELPNGSRFGPLHALAFRDLIERGDVSPDCPVVSAKTGQRSTAAAILLPFLLSTYGTQQELIARLNEDLKAQAVRREKPAADPAADAAKKALAAAEQKAAQREADLAKLRSELNTLRAERDQRASQLETARASAGEAAARIEKLTGEAQAARDQYAAAQKAAATADLKSAQAARELAQAAESLAAAQAGEKKVRDRLEQAERAAREASEQIARLTAERQELSAQASLANKAGEETARLTAEKKDLAAQVARLREEGNRWKELYEHQRTVAAAEKARAAEPPASPPDLVPRAQLEEAGRKIVQLERAYHQALQSLHRKAGSRPGTTTASPPDQWQRRDIG